LLADPSSSKLNNTSAETQHNLRTAASQKILDSFYDPVSWQGPLPVRRVVDGQSALALAREDNSMKHTLKTLGLFALAMALLTGPALAADAADGKDVARHLEEMNKLLKEIKNKLDTLDSLNTSGKLTLAEKDIMELKQRLEGLEKQVKSNEEATRTAFEKVATSLDRLNNNLTTVMKSTNPPGPNPNTTTIRLQNNSSVFATVIVNGTAYSLQSGEIRDLPNQSVGDITYSVLAEGFGQIQPPVVRTLVAGKRFNIFINP
jgi:hypothetical protein